MSTFEQKLDKYADLVVKIGTNIQPGQVLMVESTIEAMAFTRKIVRKAYEAGAKYVQVVWDDEDVTRTRFEAASDESLTYYPAWIASMMEQLAESGGAFLQIRVPDPDLYNGIDPKKVTTATRAASIARQKFNNYVRNSTFSWCIVKAPTVAWTAKVFPELPENERIDAMWETIFYMSRVNTEDPIAAWKAHSKRLQDVSRLLTAKQYKRLHYKAPGTDLSVELPQGHIWLGGGEYNSDGIFFMPNMPTEEVFSMPLRGGVNGTLSSTMPLNLNGCIVDKFWFRFQDGKVVDYTAEVGLEHLKGLLETDEGAKYLGEVALVPHDSPISNLNRIFYNTGLDENASCHFAIGNAYPINIQNGKTMSHEELLAHGANVSLTHVDFMIGSAELDIDGELADGMKEAIFRNGNWAL
jgi:aminopeptidase